MLSLPIFLINLDRSTDRLRRMLDQAEYLGVRFARVRAVDGLALPNNMRSEFLDADGSPRCGMLPGEVGCYASHLLVYVRIIADGLPYALVLEDDPTLHRDFVEIASAAVVACPASWDIIHLWHASKHSRSAKVARLSSRHWLVRHARRPINTAAYVISLAAAKKLRMPSPRTRPIDIEMRYVHLRGLKNIYSVTPPVITPDADTASTIDQGRVRKAEVGRRWRPRLFERLAPLWRYPVAS